ncbi:hydantoinase/oxoprolinase family protein [Streptomyces sp. NPDC056390]|uniref:hydantoinase/oxoprolinase family protein n=1 Tax=Streptomyces sp. NPDC056390 TaxID=3345806 RepID=UPI0035E01BE4
MAVEIGGTFTDVMWVDGDGALNTHKTPSTPAEPARAVLEALDEIGAAESTMEGFFHGSTVATNAVLTRRGARAGLLVTKGFRDVLALQRQLRGDVNQLSPRKPEPIIPTALVREVEERIDHHGDVLAPLDEQGLVKAVGELVEAQRIETLAICFLHAYRNAEHEQRALEVLREEFPQLPVIVSSEVLPVFREYERASATAICAYVLKHVQSYLELLENRFAESGTPMLVMQSSGGLLPTSGIMRRPLEMLESGPAAGVTAALTVSRRLDHPNAVTLDVGGTSTDICLITDGRPDQSNERMVDGLPLGIPALNIVNIGAGGGSLGHYDVGGMLQVGPQSAGAQPGPACYGRGGTEPSLTDALVELGWLRAKAFLGGRMTLDEGAATAALATLDRTEEGAVAAAWAIVQIAVSNMARGVAKVSVQRGRDPREHVLYAFGGMGPMIGALVAEELGMNRVVVPIHPGLFSAFGLLLADVTRTYEQTHLAHVEEAAVDGLVDVFERLERQAADEFAGYGYERASLRFDHVLGMRYQGQGFELPVDVDLDLIRERGVEHLETVFRDAHLAAYGTDAPEKVIVVVTARVVAVLVRNGLDGVEITPGPRSTVNGESARVQYRDTQVACAFLPRTGLADGAVVPGPAVIEEPTATTLVPPGWTCTVVEDRALLIQRQEA